MRIIGLDLALATGYAWGDRGVRPIYGNFNLHGFDEANRARICAALYAAVQSIVRENGIEGAVIEFPIAPKRKNSRGVLLPAGAHGVRMLTMISGAAQAGAYSGGCRHFWMPEPATWRKAVLGNGFPEKPKDEAFKYCKMVLRLNVQDHTAAEACCLVEYGHAQARLI